MKVDVNVNNPIGSVSVSSRPPVGSVGVAAGAPGEPGAQGAQGAQGFQGIEGVVGSKYNSTSNSSVLIGTGAKTFIY